MTVSAAHELDRYLATLFARARGVTFVELRWRVATGMHRRFIPAPMLGEARAQIQRLASRTDVYVAVLPRWRQAGGRAAVVGDCRVVWVDLDRDSAMRGLEPVDPAPNLVVASGAPGHVHAYWLLRRAIAPAQVERANRRLAWALDADLSSTDAARILRPPGSLNHRRDGSVVRLVVEPTMQPCDPSALIGGLVDPPIESRRNRGPGPARASPGDRLRSLAPEIYVQALTGQRIGRDRKVRCPLHEDRTPSLHVYDSPGDGWYCFGCGRGGSVFDLASALWRIEPRGAGMHTLRAALGHLL